MRGLSVYFVFKTLHHITQRIWKKENVILCQYEYSQEEPEISAISALHGVNLLNNSSALQFLRRNISNASDSMKVSVFKGQGSHRLIPLCSGILN